MRDPGPLLAVAALAGMIAAGMVLRGWAVVLAAACCFAGFVAAGGEALAWLWFIPGLPLLVGAAALGWGLGHLLPARAWSAVLGVAAVALLVVGLGEVRRASLDRAPRAVAATLPAFTSSLSGLCFSDLPARDRRQSESEVGALVREVRRRPDELVTVNYALADSPGVRREEITVQELAEETLDHADCESVPARGLRDALG